MSNTNKYRAIYLINSERSYRRADEIENELHTNQILNIGDTIELDGLTWYVVDILEDADRGIYRKEV